MSQAQKSLAFDMLRKSLSAKELKLSKDIMKTEKTLQEMNHNNPSYGEDLYFFTIMGLTAAALKPNYFLSK